MRRASILLMIWMCAGLAVAQPSQPSQPSNDKQSKNEKAVWKLEHAFCKDKVADDNASYLKLLHTNFLGWLAGSPVPLSKNQVADRLAKAAPKRMRVDSCTVDPVGSQPTENMVVDYYVMTLIVADEGGHTVRHRYRIAHTWIKSGDTWQIVGGMGVPVAETK